MSETKDCYQNEREPQLIAFLVLETHNDLFSFSILGNRLMAPVMEASRNQMQQVPQQAIICPLTLRAFGKASFLWKAFFLQSGRC